MTNLHGKTRCVQIIVASTVLFTCATFKHINKGGQMQGLKGRPTIKDFENLSLAEVMNSRRVGKSSNFHFEQWATIKEG